MEKGEQLAGLVFQQKKKNRKKKPGDDRGAGVWTAGQAAQEKANRRFGVELAGSREANPQKKKKKAEKGLSL